MMTPSTTRIDMVPGAIPFGMARHTEPESNIAAYIAV